MKAVCLFLFVMILLSSCTRNKEEKKLRDDYDLIKPDSAGARRGEEPRGVKGKVYSNARFKNVTIERVGVDSFVVEGKAQIFEANFGWVIEDGHQELKKGFEMTDAGAPAWGNFKFGIYAQKARPNSTLTLVLFESSAKDGSRQYELPVPLSTKEAE